VSGPDEPAENADGRTWIGLIAGLDLVYLELIVPLIVAEADSHRA